jgi:hypothetical protein
MGGGMTFAYHRRPVMSADDIAALNIVKLGAGVTLYGYYVFHGGTNPDGKASTLQESLATGYPNDLPVKTYDFQAPLGEFGQMRESFRDLKMAHLFLADFGAELAPMTAYFPEQMPRGKHDRETPRVAVRAGAGGGFVFFSNYQKDHPLPARKDFQVQVKLASGAVTVPRKPVNLPAGAYGFWPAGWKVAGAAIEYATAQPVARLADPATVVFAAWPGIAPEFAFVESNGERIEAPRARVTRENGRVYVSDLVPGLDAAIRVGGTQIVVLSREQARNLWKARLGGRERLVYSAGDLYFDGEEIHLSSTNAAALEFGIFPALERQPAGFRALDREGLFQRFAAPVAPVSVRAAVRQIAEAGSADPVRMGAEVAMAPPESAFQKAARWSIRVPAAPSAAVGEVLLRIAYEGDVARLYAGGRLVTDDFYHGAPWEVGLRRIAAADLERGLELQILPLRADAPVYLGSGVRASMTEGGQVAKLAGIQVFPEYQATARIP